MTPRSLLANPRPWCIGRFVIDRPAASESGSEKYEFWGDKIKIEQNVSFQTFEHRVNTRESELRSKRRTTSVSYQEKLARGLPSSLIQTDTPWLEQAVAPSRNSRLFFYKKSAEFPDELLDVESYVLAGTSMLSMTSVARPTGIQRSIAKRTDVYRHIAYRDDWTVPTEPGFCIRGALIGGPDRNSELVSQNFNMVRGKLSLLTIDMRDAVEPDLQSSLLKTLPDLRRQLSSKGFGRYVSVLREGKRQLAGMEAEEVLFSIRDGGVQLYRFYLMAPGNPDTIAQPHTEIQFMLGSPLTAMDKSNGVTPEQKSSVVDEAGAIQVWDTLLNGMRLRPGAV